MARITHLLWGLGLAAASAGCATTPPALPDAPAAFAADSADPVLAAPPRAGWIEALAAPELAAIAQEALAANPDFQAAQARAEAQRARAQGVFGLRLPSLDFDLGASRTESQATGLTADAFDARAIASWEADVWGRVRALARAADLEADAAEADLSSAALSLSGRAAQSYVDLITAAALLNLAQEDLEIRSRALAITDRRYQSGLIGALSLRTARAQVASAEAGLAQAEEDARDASRRLQTLLGRYPDAALRPTQGLPALGPLEAAGAPETLLTRRPDVRAAEARLQAAGFRLHEARASLAPRLTLSASAAGSGAQLSDALDPDALVTSLIAGLAQPIFRGGALRAEVRASEADQRAAAAGYVAAALAAWSEVEAAITADAAFAAREAALARAFEEGREAQTLAEREYARGVATIFELIDAYQRRIDAERGLVSVRGARVRNRITFHVAVAEAPFAAPAGAPEVGL